MKNTLARFSQRLLLPGLFAVMAGLLLSARPASAQDTAVTSDTATNNAEGDKVWKEVRKAAQEPMPPAEWQNQKPSREEISKFYIDALHKGADAEKDFYTRFPNHPKAADAHKTEYRLLNMAAQRFGDTRRGDRLAAIETERMKDPTLSHDERFKLRLGATQRMTADLPDKMDEFVKSTQALQKDFPGRKEPYELLLMAASESEGDTSKKLLEQIIDGNAPD